MNRIALFLAAVMMAAGARADTVHLTNGNRIDGRATADGDWVRIEVPGGTVSIPIRLVSSIDRSPTIFDEYDRRYAALAPGEVAARLELAAWCRENGLTQRNTALLEEALAIDPDSAEARRLLGGAQAGGSPQPVSDLKIEGWRPPMLIEAPPPEPAVSDYSAYPGYAYYYDYWSRGLYYPYYLFGWPILRFQPPLVLRIWHRHRDRCDDRRHDHRDWDRQWGRDRADGGTFERRGGRDSRDRGAARPVDPPGAPRRVPLPEQPKPVTPAPQRPRLVEPAPVSPEHRRPEPRAPVYQIPEVRRTPAIPREPVRRETPRVEQVPRFEGAPGPGRPPRLLQTPRSDRAPRVEPAPRHYEAPRRYEAPVRQEFRPQPATPTRWGNPANSGRGEGGRGGGRRR